jgi:hypothetical protein
MKASKKQKKSLPEVNVLGDLEDAKKLFLDITKKKTKVVFKDAEQGTFYSGMKRELKEILLEDIHKLEKDHRLIFVSFFPDQKKAEPPVEEKTGSPEPEKEEIKDEESTKDKKVKKDKKNKKPKKEKKSK